MARYETGEVVRCNGDLFIYWNPGMDDGVLSAVVERLDDYTQHDQPRFQVVRMDSITKVSEAEQRAARMVRMRTAMG